MKLCLIVTTFSKERKAKKMSDMLLRSKLVACTKSQKVKSSYWWKGKIVEETETLVMMVTTKKNVASIVSKIKREHSYAVPEILEIPVEASKDYLEWACDVTK